RRRARSSDDPWVWRPFPTDPCWSPTTPATAYGASPRRVNEGHARGSGGRMVVGSVAHVAARSAQGDQQIAGRERLGDQLDLAELRAHRVLAEPGRCHDHDWNIPKLGIAELIG